VRHQNIRQHAGSAFRAFVIGTLCLTAAVAATAQPPSGLTAAERDVLRRVKETRIVEATKTLADDRFEGRGTLQPGGERAAAWIADRMKRIGLAPGGDGGTYMQQVPLEASDFADATHVTIDGTPLAYASEWTTIGTVADMTLAAPLVFVGHGLVSKKAGRDDLKDVDLKGKIAVVIEGRPADVSAATWGGIQGDANMLPTLIARGIAGFISIPNGRELLARPFILGMLARRSVHLQSATAGRLPLLMLSAAGTERLFAGSGKTMAQAMDEAASASFTPWALPAKIDIAFQSTRQAGTAPNVIGVLKGSDPTLAAEAVVFSAHYDAYGVIRTAIYNGAADNAIGVAEMLAVAEAFAKAKVRPRRSLVFIAFTSEEYGMSGSKYYVEHATWPLEKTAAVLNLDGIGTEIMGPMTSMVAYGAAFSSLGALFTEVAQAYGVKPMDDPIPAQGVFARSDHYNFVQWGVPGLMLVGSPVDAPEAFAKKFDEFEETKYHQPSDDVYKDWHWKGALKVADMMALIGHRVAQADAMPTFTAGTPYAGRLRGKAATETPKP
jgi:Zn-dependent M28 family amino/carboxypeptidase